MHASHGLSRPALRAGLCTIGLALSGCTGAHNDVLIFATQTQVALDVSASATSGGAPSFTLGYKRNEGVWMPLVVNGQSSIPLNGPKSCDDKGHCYTIPVGALAAFQRCTEAHPVESCLATVVNEIKYTGTTSGPGGNSQDAYSVFASFGGDFGASGGGRAAMAQFFATGIAAQKLADHPEAARALKAEDNGPLVAAQAETITALRAQGAAAINPEALVAKSVSDKAVACWSKDRANYIAKAKLQPNLNSDLLTIIEGDNEDNFRFATSMFTSERDNLTAITAAACP